MSELIPGPILKKTHFRPITLPGRHVLRILIAEDDPTLQRILAGLVAKWGYDPIVVGDGQRAWEGLNLDGGPRLAIVDWMMPGLSGLEVCKRVRARTSQSYIYVVILTAKTEQQDAIAALESGADDVMTKPFDPHELRARINTAERILALEDNLIKRAFYDQLTGLPNRALLAKRFQGSRKAAVRDKAMLAVLYIDLDRFKVINDTCGHAAGDHMLKEITNRIQRCIGKAETLARVGGDEFICLAKVANGDSAADLAATILATFDNAIDTGEQRFSTSASIGISIFPQDGLELDSLLQSADAAMYDLKRRRLAKHFQFFNKDIGARRRSSLVMETRLSGALQRDEFLVYYQPILRASDLGMLGSEALIRWNDPERGMVSPADFIPIAEETGHISELGNWVLDQACSQARRWRDLADVGFRVAVNISASQFSDCKLVDIISETLARTGANASELELEMTETALVYNLEKSAETMKQLRALGVRIALDDFGTGYSSFNYLANLPIDTLKIDRSFVSGIENRRRRFSVLKAIVALAHELGIVVVAEGIESPKQLTAVRAAGCDQVQGFLFAKPEPPARMNFARGGNTLAANSLSGDLNALAFHVRQPLVVT